ncbi:MAG: M55 family metallopeptidase [Kiritimatiellaeota bacterium]|nr:M55 family metallopeptidase [Kiritimatiellota bacterium]
MRILISTDLEGVSGVCVWEQTREPTGAMYQEARRLLMADAAAVVKGCREAAADADIVVCDGHGGGFNFVPELMAPGARYLTGRARPAFSRREDLYPGFDAAILLGFHAMAGTPNAFLAHTQSSLGGNRYWYNEVESGEIVQSALVFGHFGIPVIMVSGDDATARETRRFLGDVVTVSVKEALGEQFGFLLAPQEAHARLRAGAARAVHCLPERRPFSLELPIRGRLRFPDKSRADAFRPRRSNRVDDYTFEAVFERALDIYEF